MLGNCLDQGGENAEAKASASKVLSTLTVSTTINHGTQLHMQCLAAVTTEQNPRTLTALPSVAQYATQGTTVRYILVGTTLSVGRLQSHALELGESHMLTNTYQCHGAGHRSKREEHRVVLRVSVDG